MKKLVNKVTSLSKDNKGGLMNYADLGKLCVNQPPQGGFNAEEMRSRLRLIDVLEAAKDEIELEDADADKFKALVANMNTWGVLHREILEFIDTVKAS